MPSTRTLNNSPTANNVEDILKLLTKFMEEVTTTLKGGLEKHLEVVQGEIFNMRKELDQEKKTSKLEKVNTQLQEQLKHVCEKVNELTERLDNMDQEKCNLDIVLDNIDAGAVSDVTQTFINAVNLTLMGIGQGNRRERYL